MSFKNSLLKLLIFYFQCIIVYSQYIISCFQIMNQKQFIDSLYHLVITHILKQYLLIKRQTVQEFNQLLLRQVIAARLPKRTIQNLNAKSTYCINTLAPLLVIHLTTNTKEYIRKHPNCCLNQRVILKDYLIEFLEKIHWEVNL